MSDAPHALEVTPEYVMNMTSPAQQFFCPVSANVYGLDITAFKIRDAHSGTSLFEVRKEPGSVPLAQGDDSSRFIRYQLGPTFLDLAAVGTEIEFTVGEQPIYNLLMIERHYFKGMLVKSYEFLNPFAMPGSLNTWDVVYSLPELSPEWKQELINNPYETRSDTFYFIGDKLVMHNIAEYSYQS